MTTRKTTRAAAVAAVGAAAWAVAVPAAGSAAPRSVNTVLNGPALTAAPAGAVTAVAFHVPPGGPSTVCMGPIVFTGEVHHARVHQYLESGGTDLTQLGAVVPPAGGPIPAHLYELRPGTTHDAPYALGGGQYTAVGACWSDAASGVGTATGWVRAIDDPGAGAQTIGTGSLCDIAGALNLHAVVDVSALLAPVEQAVADFNAVVGGL